MNKSIQIPSELYKWLYLYHCTDVDISPVREQWIRNELEAKAAKILERASWTEHKGTHT